MPGSVPALAPRAVLKSPVLFSSARLPTAVLLLPVVFVKSALAPVAVLVLPSVLLARASKPMAVLTAPVVLLKSTLSPIAVLKLPVVSLKSAEVPTAVFPAKSGGAVQLEARVNRRPCGGCRRYCFASPGYPQPYCPSLSCWRTAQTHPLQCC